MPPAPSSNFCGAGHITVTASTLSDLEKSNRGGTPESPGMRQYVFQPGWIWNAIPPSSTAPLRDPASSRTAECPSRCHGDASSAWAASASDDASKVVATPSAACRGTLVSIARLYRVTPGQTIELLVMDALDSHL